ncbi:tetratricopeptide repeat protein [Chryseobacterium paridis]|uniref:HTH luxR-type domain-containing protein n=1 Tax=Chryseobacterium paridis TaxID=2800328 RepID=A0ABS1FX41_9FLAO|nr:hypothetical protein [Chryseobacterium paridis]MBK1897016.1 hypothetical protein [Chryseobacterium paridis]
MNTDAQNSNREIDSISQLLEKNYIKGDTNPGITLKNATALYYLSREKKFYPGQVYSIFEEAKLYQLNGDFDSALVKINEGIDLAKVNNDNNMLCRILLLYQRVLLQLDHLNAAKQILYKTEYYNKLIKNEDDRRLNEVCIILARVDLLTISDNFDKDTAEEVTKLKKQAYSECLKINDSNKRKKVTLIYTLQSLTSCLVDQKKIDEARKYVGITERLLVSFPDNTFIVRNFITKGIIEKESQNYPLAIEYFSKAINNSQKDYNRYEQYEVYALIAESYEEMKDFEKSTFFSKRYKRLMDSITLVKKKSGDVNFINNINVKVLDTKTKIPADRSNLIIGVSVILLGVLIVVFYSRMRKKKRLNYAGNTTEDPISDNFIALEKPITENYIENNPKSEKTKELILLAKEDINVFYIEFQKMYPDFYTTLKNKYTDLNISDINFCSLLKMNFGIKEISQYTNSTIRAAEARRYRINKKMQLKSQNELYMILSTIN